jgi:putative pyruvate formate lyase activating enzyme
VYNSGGYEALDTLGSLEGAVDVYLPDMKYSDPGSAARCSAAPDYVERSREAVAEMCRQTGAPRYDAEGLLVRGTLVRHLVLPGMAAQSMRVLNWIAEHLPAGTPVSLMAQYTPCGAALADPLLRRPVTRREYELVAGHLWALGLTEGYVQRRAARNAAYIPAFDGTGVPGGSSF